MIVTAKFRASCCNVPQKIPTVPVSMVERRWLHKYTPIAGIANSITFRIDGGEYSTDELYSLRNHCNHLRTLNKRFRHLQLPPFKWIRHFEVKYQVHLFLGSRFLCEVGTQEGEIISVIQVYVQAGILQL